MGITPANEIDLSPVLFDDAGQFSEWESRLGWDIESMQLGGRAFEDRRA